MSDKDQEFPFQQFVQALQQKGDLRKKLKHIITAICQNNIYWIYSAMSTIVQIIKSKDQQAITKSRALQIAVILFQTCQYSVITFTQVYLLPLLIQVAIFRGKKSQELLSHYFKQTFGLQLTPQTSKLSLQYVERSVQFIFHAARIKPFRTVQTQELEQESHFSRAVRIVTQKGVEQPTKYKHLDHSKHQEDRKCFQQKLKKFNHFSDQWTEFLLVNLLQEIKTNKKQLLQLRLLVPYGESFLTSAIINFCQEQLVQITDRLDEKRKYLALLNELVRNGDIQAIILVKNSDFIPTITAHISKLAGHTGINAGQNIFPEIKATKQLKKQFYVDFLRSLETWAICLPQQYDSDQFNIKSIWQFLKTEKKFKFPENLNLARFQKQIKQNLQKNKERNERILQILQNMDSSKQQSMDKPAISKMSNVLQKTTLLAPTQLQARLDQIKRQLKNLIGDQQTSSKSFKNLINFKDSWITYLQSIDFEGADQNYLQNLINLGERYVEQIQMIVPLMGNLSKKKLSFKQFKQKAIQALAIQNDISHNNLHQKSKQLLKSISIKASRLNNSKVGQSKLGKSKIGKSILDKIKAKSKIGDKTKLDMSKAMNRSNMLEKSKYLDKSKSYLQKSKNNDLSQKKINPIIKEQIKSAPQVKNKEKKKSDEEENQELEVQPSIHKFMQGKQNFEKSVQKKESSRFKTEKSSLKKSVKEKSQAQQKKQQDSEDEKIVRVADYEVQNITNKEKSDNPRLFQSRNKSQGSRILLRRNNGSRLDKSQDSIESISKRSASSRKLKDNSLFKNNRIEHEKTKKVSQILQEMHNNNIINSQTIEVHGNIVNQITHTEKKNSKIEDKQFNKFNEEVGQISSIRSNSNIKMFHHSAEKILNITGQISEIKNEKQKEKQKQTKVQSGEYYPKETILPPMVANVCQSPKMKSKVASPSVQKKIVLHNAQRQQNIEEKEDIPDFKVAFAAKTQKNFSKDKFLKTETKIKKQNESQAQKKLSNDQRQFRKTTKEIKTQKYMYQPQGERLSLKQTQYYKKSPATQKIINQKQQLKEQKEKQIQALRQKVLQLQKQSAFMRAKLAAKDNQIRSIKSASKDCSSRGFAHFTSPSTSNYQKSSLRSSSASRRVQQTQFQRQIQSVFKQYLQKIKGNTFRKSLLKSKCLVHKTEQIQIGCLSQRGDKLLDSTLYITPHRFDLLQFTVSVIHDSSLKVKISPDYIKCIPTHKQQKIYLTTEVLKVPFCLPEIQINYKGDSQYSSNYYRLTLPLGFNKYCLIQPLDPDIPTQKNIKYVKTDNFKPNPKVLKVQKLSESFPSFYHMAPSKNRQQHIFIATCHYAQSIFNLSLNLHQKYAWIQGFLIEGQPKVMNFLICTMKQIIQGSKK